MAWIPIIDDARHTGRDMADTVSETGDAIKQEVLTWVPSMKEIFNQLVAAVVLPEIAAAVAAYIMALETQAELAGYRTIPDDLTAFLKNHYSIDWDQVRYAEHINTIHGQGVTIGHHIFFPEDLRLSDSNDIRWLLHELEHVSQYESVGGVNAFLAKYAVQVANEILRTGSLNVHDFIELEKDADAKAKRVLPAVEEWLEATGTPVSPDPELITGEGFSDFRRRSNSIVVARFILSH